MGRGVIINDLAGARFFDSEVELWRSRTSAPSPCSAEPGFSAAALFGICASVGFLFGLHQDTHKTIYFGLCFIRRRTTEPVLIEGNGSFPILDNPGISPAQSPPDSPGDDQNSPRKDDRGVGEHAQLVEHVFDNLIHRQTIPDPHKDMCAAKYRRIAIHYVLSHELSSRADVRFGSLADIAACPRDVRFTPRKQTFAPHNSVSALGHSQPSW
jgi:hypothetical protein